MKERETTRKTDKMTEAEQQVCCYFDQRRDFDLENNELDAETLEGTWTDHADDIALETAVGFLVLPHHPKEQLNSQESDRFLKLVAR